jgi:glycosyltransferase involved in cell wall biosynthesis
MSKEHWVVVQYGSRDRYQLPIAVKESESLLALVTEWYSKYDQSPTKWLDRLDLSKLHDWLKRRYNPQLPGNLVLDNKIAAVFFMATKKLGVPDTAPNYWLGRKAGKLATRSGANLLSTSYVGASAFRSYAGAGVKVLLQAHPSPRFLRNLYTEFISRGGLNERLGVELEMSATEEGLVKWEDEARLADNVIVSSEFSKRSVESLGISDEYIDTVPYGVDLKMFVPGRQRSGTEPLRIFFLGSKCARKGLHILLEAWSRLAPQRASLRIAGGAEIRDGALMDAFPGIGEELPRLTLPEVIREFQEADLFVMPSLAEGFGHVYLEALACGTPILGTENTAVPDLLKAGDCGFTTEAGNVDDLASTLESLLSNPKLVADRRAEARRVAEQHSWQNFRVRVRRTLEKAIHQRKSTTRVEPAGVNVSCA